MNVVMMMVMMMVELIVIAAVGTQQIYVEASLLTVV